MLSQLTLGPLTFLAPLALLGLIILPLIWWLLRITPPKPVQQSFPPLRILQNVVTEDETPNSTPLWLLMFRLFLVALAAIALSQPLMSKPEGIEDKPLILVIEDSWDAAPNWPKISKEAENRIADARRKNMPVMIMQTTKLGDIEAEFVSAADALRRVKTMVPAPVKNDRKSLQTAFKNLPEFTDEAGARKTIDSDLIWLSSGVTEASETDKLLAESLSNFKSKTILSPIATTMPLVPGKLSETVDGFRSLWHRASGNGIRTTDITAHGRDGRVIGRGEISFAPNETQAEAMIELPSELRSRVTALRATDSVAAGSVMLLDDSWGRPLIGVMTEGQDSGSPLLSEPFYAETALKPYADVYRGSLDDLLPLSPSIIVMPDAARSNSQLLKEFVDNGGLLIRFAGPKLAKRTDTLIPVALRQGGRALGGALTWEDPQNLSEFAVDSPFFGLTIPDDIEVKSQVMAEPGAETDSRTWARLQDGSPIVTTSEQGFGRIVLFHVTAGPDWSNIPVSGLYVEMLRRLLTLSKTSKVANLETGTGDWAPERVLNGYGRLVTPNLLNEAIPNNQIETTTNFTLNPPGLYRQGPRRKALNLKTNPDDYREIAKLSGIDMANYGKTTRKNLGGILLAIALTLLALDAIFAILAAGRLRALLARFRPSGKLASLLVIGVVMGVTATDAQAQDDEYFEDALSMHLAYIKTGNARTDEMSEAAMQGLVNALTKRTTIEPGGVRGVNPETDNLVYYPFLYWPIDRDTPPLSDKEVTALNGFMASGGTLVLDTQDSGDQFLRDGAAHPGLKRVTEKLDIPALKELPEDHVINKTFYLINVYPGRWANGKVWVDKNQNGVAQDGVSSVIIGSNDWAAAWAEDEDGTPLIELERDIPRQRKMALRFGVNLAMYALAGNYKADQVHSKALIERIGQIERLPENLGADIDDEEDKK